MNRSERDAQWIKDTLRDALAWIIIHIDPDDPKRISWVIKSETLEEIREREKNEAPK